MLDEKNAVGGPVSGARGETLPCFCTFTSLSSLSSFCTFFVIVVVVVTTCGCAPAQFRQGVGEGVESCDQLLRRTASFCCFFGRRARGRLGDAGEEGGVFGGALGALVGWRVVGGFGRGGGVGVGGAFGGGRDGGLGMQVRVDMEGRIGSETYHCCCFCTFRKCSVWKLRLDRDRGRGKGCEAGGHIKNVRGSARHTRKR